VATRFDIAAHCSATFGLNATPTDGRPMATTHEQFIEAAGGVVCRPAEDGVEIAVVHRPKYDDWSLPKGKLEPGEHPLLAALREVTEETGFVARPGRELGELKYLKDGRPKRVRYWSMQVLDGEFVAGHEVDALRWLAPHDAVDLLDPGLDRPIVESFAVDVRPTVPIVLVRHASAAPAAASSRGADRERVLDDAGQRQALALAVLLAAMGIERVLAADIARCLDTVRPFATHAGLDVEPERLLSEAGFAAAPVAALQLVLAVAADDVPAVLCSQGPVIQRLFGALRERLGGPDCDAGLATGELLVLHCADGGRDLVAVDRYSPLP